MQDESFNPADREFDGRVTYHRCTGEFDERWQQDPANPPRIEDFLPEDSELRCAVLSELVRIDAEYRSRFLQQDLLRSYRDRFPELADDPVVAALFDQASSDPAPDLDDNGLAIPGYRTVGGIGRGGMGVVYKAWQLKVNRLVALKVFSTAEFSDDLALARFLREAETIGRLNHPNIIRIYDAGRHRKLPYMAVELATHGSLADLLRRGPLPERETAELLKQFALAVHAAHGAGVIHRDLKPANVLLFAKGNPDDAGRSRVDTATLLSHESRHIAADLNSLEPKIADFGLALFMEGESRLTQTGTVLGTPCYMAPEQTRGDKAVVGPSADIYALGVILYECLTGHPPFQGKSAVETMGLVRESEPVHPRRLRKSIPRDLETICLKCLAKEPSRRYCSAQELADDLDRFLNHMPVLARRPKLPERVVRWGRRRPAVALLLIVLCLVALGGMGGILYQWNQVAVNRDQAENARRDAEEHLAEVRQLLSTFLQIGQSGLTSTTAEGRHLIRNLLAEAEQRCKYLTEKPNVSADEWALSAHVHLCRGQLEYNAGNYPEAQRHLHKALDQLNRVLKVKPADRHGNTLAIQAASSLGHVYVKQNQREQALRYYHSAYQFARSLTVGGRTAADRRRVAEAAVPVAAYLYILKRETEALSLLDPVLIDLEAFEDADATWRSLMLAHALNAKGDALSSLGCAAEAKVCWLQARQHQEKALAGDSASAEQFACLGNICWKLMNPDKNDPQYQEAVKSYRQGCEMAAARLRLNPTDLKAHHTVQMSLLWLAQTCRAASQPFPSGPVWERLFDLQADSLDALCRSSATLHQSLGLLCQSSDFFHEFGLQSRALAPAAKAANLLLANQFPPVPGENDLRCAVYLHRVAHVLRRAGDEQLALKCAQRSCQLFSGAVEREPDNQNLILNLWESWEQTGKAYAALDKPTQAAEAWIAGTRFLEKVLARNPKAPFHRRLGDRYIKLGRHFRGEGKWEEAEHWFHKYAEFWEKDANKLHEAAREFEELAAAVGTDKQALTADEEKTKMRYLQISRQLHAEAVHLATGESSGS